MAPKATVFVDTLELAGYTLKEDTGYSVEFSKKENGNDKQVYIDYAENSISIDVYNASDRLIDTQKIVVKHVSDLNRAAQSI